MPANENAHMHFFGVRNKAVVVAATGAVIAAVAAAAQSAPDCVQQTKRRLNKSCTLNIEIISLHSSINIYFLLVNIDSILNHFIFSIEAAWTVMLSCAVGGWLLWFVYLCANFSIVVSECFFPVILTANKKPCLLHADFSL